jgi:nitrogen PTS system EIIA component
LPDIAELLHPRHVVLLDRDADVIAELCRVVTQNAWQRQALETAVRQREEMASTALDCGVAVPHGHVPELDHFVLAVAVCPAGLDWAGQPHGKPVRLVVLIGAPEGQQTPYLRLLSRVVKLCSRPDVREQLCGSQDPDEIVALLTDAAH